jgi:hypothetical protein
LLVAESGHPPKGKSADGYLERFVGRLIFLAVFLGVALLVMLGPLTKRRLMSKAKIILSVSGAGVFRCLERFC